MLGQFSTDIVTLYPDAEVLAIEKDQLKRTHNRKEAEERRADLQDDHEFWAAHVGDVERRAGSVRADVQDGAFDPEIARRGSGRHGVRRL